MPTDGGPLPQAREIEARVLEFIRGQLVDPGVAVGRQDDLLTELLDSVAALSLASFVAEEFEIEIRPADYVIENFQTAAAIAEYVRRAAGRAAGARPTSIR